MTVTATAVEAGAAGGGARERRWLIAGAAAVTVFGLLHHLDHSIRGNHVGWPLSGTPTPFTFSLLIYAFLLPGIYFTARGRLGAGYWLAVGLAGLALVVFVHFVPTEDYESFSDIYTPYAEPLEYVATEAPANRVAFFRDTYAPHASAAWGWLAIADMYALVLSLVALIATAAAVRRRSGHW